MNELLHLCIFAEALDSEGETRGVNYRIYVFLQPTSIEEETRENGNRARAAKMK
jgi:hypothetical protein